jgi:hypothetical protein
MAYAHFVAKRGYRVRNKGIASQSPSSWIWTDRVVWWRPLGDGTAKRETAKNVGFTRLKSHRFANWLRIDPEFPPYPETPSVRLAQPFRRISNSAIIAS